ncbi:MAG: hypothetical protein E3K32_11860 [wastewater metagenome]|nr:hypothetical protein [Candidatus Loosdrechtia aerotolerans]
MSLTLEQYEKMQIDTKAIDAKKQSRILCTEDLRRRERLLRLTGKGKPSYFFLKQYMKDNGPSADSEERLRAEAFKRADEQRQKEKKKKEAEEKRRLDLLASSIYDLAVGTHAQRLATVRRAFGLKDISV